MDEKIERLRKLQHEARQGGGQARIDRQHKKGQLTARERLEVLFDPGSFSELGMLVEHRTVDFGLAEEIYLGDGVVTGYGLIDGRLVYAFAQDFTVFGGSLSETHAEKICKVMDLAVRNRAPFVGLNDSGGARIQEGVRSLGGYADIFYRNVQASGQVPQISAIMGPCAGGAVYSPAMTDFTLMVEGTSYMFVTGPNVVKTVTNETVSSEELGGAKTHATKSGVTHLTAANDVACLAQVRRLLSYLPSSCDEQPPSLPAKLANELRPKLRDMVPDAANQPYDMAALAKEIIDAESWFEIQPDFGSNIVTAFGRLGGKAIGIIGNQPMSMAGVLDVAASRKAARFVRTCDCFNVPLLVLVDVPGFLPGTDQEWQGIITHGAKLLYAFSEATVPRVTLITRKAYGGAYDVMNSKHIGADYNFAWPTAEIAVMGSKGASEIIFRREIQASANPDAMLAEREADYAREFAHPYRAAARGFIDEVIEPSQTRRTLLRAFASLENKRVEPVRRKHGNIPL